MTLSAPQPASAVGFEPLTACWICGGTQLTPYHTLRFDLAQYRNGDQDHELAAYTGSTLQLVRCARCGFGQPEAMPSLPRYFDRMYDQWHDPRWIETEFRAGYKDFIFASILRELERRAGRTARRLLDVGAHAGRFLHLASRAGWRAEGIELNPRTAAFAAAQTGVPVHRMDAAALASDGRRYDVIVLTDVLEHIPQPVGVLSTLASLLEPNGVIAVKVPCGPSQLVKEQVLAAITSHRATIADNLVHVNHFSPRSLRLAMERAGFAASIAAAAPELAWSEALSPRARAGNVFRKTLYTLGRLPGAVHTPLALHLQAFGRKVGA